MQISMPKKVLVAVLACGLFGGLVSLTPTNGQDATKKAVAKEPAKAKGRLPAYYKEIVTETQKEEIYTLQTKYDSQLDALTGQLDTLRKQRDTEIEALLTPDQKSKLTAARAAADSKKKKKPAETATKKTAESEKKTAGAK